MPFTTTITSFITTKTRTTMECITDDLTRSILESHDHVNGYADFQKRSFEHFLDELLPHIVAEHSEIVYESKNTNQ